MEAKGREEENKQKQQQPYHQPQTRRPSVVCTDIVLPQREFVQQGYQPKKDPGEDDDPRNILKNTKDIIWPIIIRRGSLPRQSALDSESGVYLGPPESPGLLSGRRRSSVDNRRPSLITFLEEEMKPSKPQFYTPQPSPACPRPKSLNTSNLEKNISAGDNGGGGVYLGPSEREERKKKKPLSPHPSKILQRQETKLSLVCSMLGTIPQREFVETGYDPTEVVKGRLDRLDSIESSHSRPSLTSTTILPTSRAVVSSVLVRQESTKSIGTNPCKTSFYSMVLH